MPEASARDALTRIANRSGMRIELNANGSLHRIDVGATSITLFPGNELEGGPANLYLRCRGASIEYTPLLGPDSPTRFESSSRGTQLLGCGQWRDFHYTLSLELATQLPVWFWHLWLENRGSAEQTVDLVYAQDIALAPYGMVRTNELYVSQYVDHTPLTHATRGVTVASRQNLAIAGRHPWCIIGSLRKACAFATDAVQLYGLTMRTAREPAALRSELPAMRLQHEHSLIAIQDEPICVPARGRVCLGFVGRYMEDHPTATAEEDLRHLDAALALTVVPVLHDCVPREGHSASLFSTAPLLQPQDLEPSVLTQLFGQERRHIELDEDGTRLSFFRDAQRHVVLPAKEQRVLRPHAHILRTGRQLVPDEAALTSTAWMSGVFHSMLTQGHVSINRCISAVRSYLSLFRSQGVRIFIEVEQSWQLLDVPSAFEMAPRECRWFYQHAAGLIEVFSRADAEPRLVLGIRVHLGAPVRVLISHHLALNGDDGSACGSPLEINADSVAVTAAAGSELGRRFPNGKFRVRALRGTRFEHVGADELLFLDRRSRGLPYVCVIVSGELIDLELTCELVTHAFNEMESTLGATPFDVTPAAGSVLQTAVQRLGEIAPWWVHNALIHYLAPRGLEQYSGGGWGTRDVSQGPVELLLALGATQPVRELLLRVMGAQNPDGDWPQWFMFFERERTVRAEDSHGDIVFWPLLALAQYLLASGDATLLEESVAFFDARGADCGEVASVWQHVQRALQLIERRRIAGTALAAYGHGDWNDSLQPVDPAMREHLCSAWTVTLHHQMLTTLARALRALRRAEDAMVLEQQAASVQGDLQRLLLVDGVLAGYVLFTPRQEVRYLLHPRDTVSGVRYSALAMIHAILEEMFTPEQAKAHLALIEQHLSGPDGARLFDRPLPYHGGPQRFFQRAESATFFGREIGLMYMHAHLRYVQALAHLGEAERFFRALCQANPIGIREWVPTATLRQANCFYSSSDAAFADRYQASAEYERIREGRIALEAGWRVYSSGAGIAVGLLVRQLLGITQLAATLRIDPVMPVALDGLQATLVVFGHPLQLRYRVQGPGYGVTAVKLNERQLQFSYERNPYRSGAALVSKAEILAALRRSSGPLTLYVSVGDND